MRLLARRHGDAGPGAHEHETGGMLLDRGWRYDLEVWFFDTFLVGGKIRELREKVLDQAELVAGQSILDVGCGTGTLAITAAARVGPTGRVVGIEPAPRQISRARAKARRLGLDIDFRSGVIEELPFAPDSFDAVTSTLMMHHLPDDLKARGIAEIDQVLKSGGRLAVADFEPGNNHRQDRVHGQAGTADLVDQLKEAGFRGVQVDPVLFPREHHGWRAATLLSTTKH
jgi:ubiquinone/menaquinone biosynthesis C-methylase UbiE